MTVFRSVSGAVLAAAGLTFAMPGASVEGQVHAEATPAALVSRAIDALGGAAFLGSLASIEIHATGNIRYDAQIQGRSPDGGELTSYEDWLVIDHSGGRVSHEYRTTRTDGSPRWRRFVYAGEQRTVIDFVTRGAGRMSHADAARTSAALMRRVPHLLLLEAARTKHALRPLGDVIRDGRRYQALSFEPPAHDTPLRFLFDEDTGLLVRVEYGIEYPGIGDTDVELIFAEYHDHEALHTYPRGHTLRIGGVPYEALEYVSVAANDARVQASFELPEDIAARLAQPMTDHAHAGMERAHRSPSQEAAAAQPGAVIAVAPGVYVVHALEGFTTMFVEFDDFVLAVEAPAHAYVETAQIPIDLPPTDALSEQLIARIRTTVPGKPIRYVAVSHHHNDHAGGVGAFWAEGATLLTTPGTRRYFAQLSAARSRAQPDRPGASREARIEGIADRRVITDGRRTVELISSGPDPHTDEALVVYLPRERILYQGDQFYFSGEASFPPADRSIVMRHFAGWLEDRGLEVDRIYGTHMRGFATRQHVGRLLDDPAATPPDLLPHVQAAGARRR